MPLEQACASDAPFCGRWRYHEVMFGGNEWLIVVIVALVLFGGSQLPKLAKNLGSAQKEFKKGLAEGKEDEEAPTAPSSAPKTSGAPAASETPSDN